mmetsp:Transcript_49610/g.105575  ORF Transcript_49610/g.105575 Transcript_49610/m.105575 type:complete len:213 (-) Transcript_49610:46-684(-)
MNVLSHLRVKSCEKLVFLLDNGHLQGAFLELFGHFHTDKTAATDHNSLRMRCRDVLFDSSGVFHGSQGKVPSASDAWYVVRNDRPTAGGKYEVIIFLSCDVFADQILYEDSFVLTIDGYDLGVQSHIDVVPCAQLFRRGHLQILPLAYFSADVVRQPTIGEGSERRLLENGDLNLLREPSQSGGSTSSTCHSTNDDHSQIAHGSFSVEGNIQ